MTVMCGRKLVGKNTTEEEMNMLVLKETVEGSEKANGVRWYGHVLRRDNDSEMSAKICKKNGVNPAKPIKGIKIKLGTAAAAPATAAAATATTTRSPTKMFIPVFLTTIGINIVVLCYISAHYRGQGHLTWFMQYALFHKE